MMNAVADAWHRTRDALADELRRAGYDPRTLTELPCPDTTGPALARAIRAWRAEDERMQDAQTRTSGWRY
jgi:hypothetical protein